jgi:hypothetical protein
VHRALLPLLAAALVVPAASATPQSGFSFGRVGGNIRPYTVTIAETGVVRAFGAAQIGRTKLTKAQVDRLTRVASAVRFGTLPAASDCPGTSPDVAATFVRVRGRTIRVHGTCLVRYQRILTELVNAVKLS